MNGQTDSRFVLDTNAVIFLAKNAGRVGELRDELNKAALYISGITEIELFAKASLPIEEEDMIRTFLSKEISIIDLTQSVKEKAVSLRRSTKLKLPDCIVAATAIVLDAILITNDRHLLDRSLPNLRTLNC